MGTMYNLINIKKSILILISFTIALHAVSCYDEDKTNPKSRMFRKQSLSNSDERKLNQKNELSSKSSKIYKNAQSIDKTKCLNYFSKCNKEMKSMIDCNNETQWGQLGFIHCCKTCFKITRKWKREERKRRINERKPKGNSGDVDTPKKDNTPKEDGSPKKDNAPNCKNYPLSNNGRCGCRFKTFCKSGFCSRWGWCGPGNDARDKNGASWEDPTSYNHKYSAKFVPKECLDIPKEDETPKGDDTPKDNDVPKEDETPKGDDTPKDGDAPKEDETPKDNDVPKEDDA